jgi:hypothetical protein
MLYTVRFAHLKDKPNYKVGDIIKPKSAIGIMGNTGTSTAIHLHLDCVEGKQTERYTLGQIDEGRYKSSPRQLNYFIDSDLFRVKPFITSYYADPEYQALFKKIHHGYDVVPMNRHSTTANYIIYWNRSMNGTVVKVLDNDPGYGHCIYICFEA